MTFPAGIVAPFKAQFRLIPADRYVKLLQTDRSHMRDAQGGWLSPPPPWSCIGQGSNLMEIVDFSHRRYGDVLEDFEFFEKFAGSHVV